MKGITAHHCIHYLIGAWLLACVGAVSAQVPANDAFVAARALTGNVVQDSGNNVNATPEPGEPRHGGVGNGASVWWQWTASGNFRTIIDTVGSDFDTVLAVYTGSSVSQLSLVASNDDSGIGVQSQVRFNAIAGTTYRIAVDAYQGSRSGSIALNLLSADPAPTLSSNPASGATLVLPDGGLGSSSQLLVDLIATGGVASANLAITCSSNSGVLIGPAGSQPDSTRFAQTVVVGAQPVDLALAAQLTDAAQTLPDAVTCVATPSAGAGYNLNFHVRRPAALAADAAPVISSIPPSGSTLNLQAAVLGGVAAGMLDLSFTRGLGSGSAVLACVGSAGLQLAAATGGPGSAQVTQTVLAQGPVSDLQLGAVTAATAYSLTLTCNVTPSSGTAYALVYTVAVPAGLVPGSLNWNPIGPGPVAGGQVEGLVGPPANAVSGAVNVVLPHPSNADILYVGSVNGGVWRSDNARDTQPHWTALTDRQASLSIGALVFDAADPGGNTLMAGIGRTSSFSRIGGGLTGLLRSSNGGASWSSLAGTLVGKNIIGLAVNGDRILIGSNAATSNSCDDFGLFRSTDGGANFQKLVGAQGFGVGPVTALVSDPAAPQTIYAHLDSADACSGAASANGIYRSTDGGATWQNVGSADMNVLLRVSGKVVRAQAAAGGRIAVAIADTELRGVFHSSDAGASWTSMGYPQTFEGANPVGIHPGGQGRLHMSLAIDRGNPNLVYVGGDRQPGSFPNSLGARDFSGRLFRGEVNALGGSWVSLTHSGTANNSAPHADSRSMATDAAGRLIEGDDGGVYARLQPTSTAGSWISLNGDLQVTEQHNIAFDRVAGVALSGNQDNGSMRQTGPEAAFWAILNSGDGGDVAVDVFQAAQSDVAVSYSSAQRLNEFSRRRYSASNASLEVSYPELIGTDGSLGPAGLFVTPIASNQVAGHRLVIGGSNGVFESLDSGDTTTLIGEGVRARAPMSSIALAYGAAGNPDILYVAGCQGSDCLEGGDDGLFVRTALGGPLNLVRVNSGGLVVQAVVVDRGNPAQAFAFATGTDGLQALLQTTNTGASWADILGDFPSSAGVIRSLRHIEAPAGDALVVGADSGVYIAAEAQNYRSWTRLGEGLPNAPVSELDYDPSRNLLIAGTLGRGTHTLALPRLKANPGWSGVWYDPAFDGQGFQFDVMPEQEQLVIAWYTHSPGELPRTRSNLTWFTGVGALANGIANVSVVRSRGSFDAPSNFLEQAGNVRVQFSDCRNAVVEYDLNVGGVVKRGRTALQRLSSDSVCEAFRSLGDAAISTLPAPAATDRFQYGMTGTWYNPATDGQGMLLEYFPQSQQLLAGWYTYDFTDQSPQGAQPPLWMTALGSVNGNVADLQVTLTRGGGFVGPTPVTSSSVGTLRITVESCTALRASYTLSIDGQQRSGQFPMQRLTSAGLCRPAGG